MNKKALLAAALAFAGIASSTMPSMSGDRPNKKGGPRQPRDPDVIEEYKAAAQAKRDRKAARRAKARRCT